MRTDWIAALALVLGACASGGGGSAATSDALRGTSWTIVEIQGEAIDAGGEGRAVTRHRKSGGMVELLAGERVVLRLAPKPVAAP